MGNGLSYQANYTGHDSAMLKVTRRPPFRARPVTGLQTKIASPSTKIAGTWLEPGAIAFCSREPMSCHMVRAAGGLTPPLL